MYFIATWSLSYDESQYLLQNMVGNEPEGDQESLQRSYVTYKGSLVKDFPHR